MPKCASKHARLRSGDRRGWADCGLKSLFAAEQDRPKIAWRRKQLRKYQGRLDPPRPVFIDETWVKTNMILIRGWARKRRKFIGKVPLGHWCTQTFIAVLRSDRIDAPWRSFTTCVEQLLAPKLLSVTS